MRMNRRHFVFAQSSTPLLAQTIAPEPELEWVDAKKLSVEGLGFKDVKAPYDRLPGRAEGLVPSAVWSLSRDSAGALVPSALYCRNHCDSRTLDGDQ